MGTVLQILIFFLLGPFIIVVIVILSEDTVRAFVLFADA
jgi:hypothetical protein